MNPSHIDLANSAKRRNDLIEQQHEMSLFAMTPNDPDSQEYFALKRKQANLSALSSMSSMPTTSVEFSLEMEENNRDDEAFEIEYSRSAVTSQFKNPSVSKPQVTRILNV